MPFFFSWWILLSHLFTLNMDRKYPLCWAQTKDSRSEWRRLVVKSPLNQYVISLAVFWHGHCHCSQQTDASMNWFNNDEWRIADQSWLRLFSNFFTTSGQYVKNLAPSRGAVLRGLASFHPFFIVK